MSAVLEAIKLNFKLWNDGSLGGMFIIGKIALYSAMLWATVVADGEIVQRILVLNLVEISKDLPIFISILLIITGTTFDSEPVCYLRVKHFVRSLCATRAHEHFKLCAHFLSSYEYVVNLSISVVVLRAYPLNIYITMSLRCPRGP